MPDVPGGFIEVIGLGTRDLITLGASGALRMALLVAGVSHELHRPRGLNTDSCLANAPATTAAFRSGGDEHRSWHLSPSTGFFGAGRLRARPVHRLVLPLEAAGQPSSHLALAKDLIGKQPSHSWRASYAYPHLTTLESEGDATAVTTLERRPGPAHIRNRRVSSFQSRNRKRCWHVSRFFPGHRMRGTYVHLHLQAVAHPAGAQHDSSDDQIRRCTSLRF